MAEIGCSRTGGTELPGRLHQCALFSSLTAAQIETMLCKSRRAELRPGEMLFEQRQPAKEFFLLDSGQIKLTRGSSSGQEKIIDLVSSGDTFAEASALSPQPLHPVTATALVYSEVFCFDALTYTQLLRQSTEACFALMELMSQRMHCMLMEIDRLTLHGATYRVLSYLLDHVSSTDITTSTIRLNTSKTVLASRLSVTPETLSRTLARLGREGYLSIDDNSITLRDVGQVRRYLQTA